MSDTISIDGTEYELDDDPSLRTVRNVQSMQMDILLEYLSEDDLQELDSLEDEGQLVQMIIENEGYEAFQDVMWDNSMMLPVQTISLACDKPFSSEDFNDMGAKKFKDIKDKSEQTLNGDANDFFEDLGLGMSLTEEEMKRKAQQAGT